MSSEKAGSAASSDREERIRQRAYKLWEEAGRPEGTAQEHGNRAALDLDREDGAIHRESIAGEKPGVKTRPAPASEKTPSERS